MNRSPSSARFEFHVAREMRRRYGLDAPWFSLTGNILVADVSVTRQLAHRMNQERAAAGGAPAAEAELHAMGLIDEILHYVCGLYRDEVARDAFARALAFLRERLGAEAVESLLARFTDSFPPLAVHRGDLDHAAWLDQRSGPLSHREMAIEEVLVLWLGNVNPACGPFRELFDDRPLAASVAYAPAIEGLQAFFAQQPPFGPDRQSLIDMLRSPALASPHSLFGQLEFIRMRWGHLLGDLLRRLLLAMDLIREEERARELKRAGAAALEGRAPVADFRGAEHEAERFSPDRDWMPRVVLMAKSTHVWMDQLSRNYGRTITRIDQMPDEELDRLARWGITGLWLIGLWERSEASRRIKQLCGNPDAAASAYSLDDYAIAGDLGGDPAWANLRDRAWQRGIRLASDMVPNHMGIDSRWVIEHPHWFLSVPHPPYPSYSFNGPDLSRDSWTAIHLEDHYYDRSDAAVVFKRADRSSGETRYIYHGNDGTQMPWNDTAQLDFLNPEVREGVIQTILHVARHFPIIRFDAAMTLARRHIQRLWFPEPGGGGAIPSRAEHGMTRDEFNAAMPVEFWREVVDRVAAEAPETLLLAEAFWLMEGYFVRTLGMHRVYNSAFMVMLRDEDNANYRSVIKNTLEFDPEVLKRYVNFVNNPDERTAIDQFGNGDKYFGVCTMMATLPGLPMFGHGQIEGFTEKYGMEYRRASRIEEPDSAMVARHDREIFPLLHRRHVFAEARDFRLYDLYGDSGQVNEDVFAYSNRSGSDRALVIYNNRYAEASGWIRESAAFAVKTGPESKELRRSTLVDALGLANDPALFCVFRDLRSGEEFVRAAREICDRGLHVQLGAYGCRVYLDFREVRDSEREPWAEVARELGGAGTASAWTILRAIRTRPITQALSALLAPAVVEALFGPAAGRPAAIAVASRHFSELVSAARREAGLGAVGHDESVEWFGRALQILPKAMVEQRAAPPGNGPRDRTLAFAGAAVLGIARAIGDGKPDSKWPREWGIQGVLDAALRNVGVEPWRADKTSAVTVAAASQAALLARAAGKQGDPSALIAQWRSNDVVRDVLAVNQHAGVWWFNREACEGLLATMARVVATDPDLDTRQRTGVKRLAVRIVSAAAKAEYRLEEWSVHLKPEPRSPRPKALAKSKTPAAR